METLFEGETVESRLAFIQLKLNTIPMDDQNLMRYYVFYKNDISFLLELLEMERAK